MPIDSATRTRHPANGQRRTSRELLDYYITPTRDFTQFTRDYEEQYWSKDTAFPWHQSVAGNLQASLDGLTREAFWQVAVLTLSLVEAALDGHIRRVRDQGVPTEEDALKAIAESLPSNRTTIQEALAILAPLARLQLPVAQLKDQLAILKWQHLELREQQRLGLFRDVAGLRRVAGEAERREQAADLSSLRDRTRQVQRDLAQAQTQGRAEGERLRREAQARCEALQPRLVLDLEETHQLVGQALRAASAPLEPQAFRQVQELVLKRQLRALKDIANHALVVEQSAIAPLSMGVIHFKRRREIQEAMTTFVNDEAKHSAVFRRFMAEKLEAKERVPHAIIKGGDQYLWIARFMPSGAVFLAVVVEAIGAAFLGFFSHEEHMPDPLFRGICKTIADRDEKRHIELCAATYNELYRRGTRWERFRNDVALKMLLKAAYGDKTEDNHLIQACRAFGVDSQRLYGFVASHLSEQLTKIGMYVPVPDLLEFLPKALRTPASP